MLVLHLTSMKKDLHKSLWKFMYKLPSWFIEEKCTIANVVTILLILNHDFQNGNSHQSECFPQCHSVSMEACICFFPKSMASPGLPWYRPKVAAWSPQVFFCKLILPKGFWASLLKIAALKMMISHSSIWLQQRNVHEPNNYLHASNLLVLTY